MSHQYATPEQVKLIAKPEIDITAAEDEINALINGVSAWIDKYTDFPAEYWLGIGPDGTKQKIRNTVDGFVNFLTPGIFVAELTAADLPGSPIAVVVTASGGEIAAQLAFLVRDALAANATIAAFATITQTDERVDVERLESAASDPTFNLQVRESTPAQAQTIVTTDSVEITAGVAGVGPSDRVYRGEAKPYLRIGPHVGDASITSPVIAPSIIYEDRNGWIRYNDSITNQGDDDYFLHRRPDQFFSPGTSYTVSARWGFLETPDDIVTACALIVGDLLDRGAGVIGQISPSGFVIERSMPLAARDILDNNRRREFQVV